MKPTIRNEFRFAFRAGELSEIPVSILEQLRTLYSDEENSKPGCYDAHGNITEQGVVAEALGEQG